MSVCARARVCARVCVHVSVCKDEQTQEREGDQQSLGAAEDMAGMGTQGTLSSPSSRLLLALPRLASPLRFSSQSPSGPFSEHRHMLELGLLL